MMLSKTLFVITVFAMLRHSFVLSLKNDGTCGVAEKTTNDISERIFHGQSFDRGSFPWIVALMHIEFRPAKFFCAGTLISETFVVSAAHCILQKGATKKLWPRDIRALFGAHDLSDPYESGRIMQSPQKILVHEDWNPKATDYDGDLSLLEFEKGSITFNRFIKPICLWESDGEPSVIEGTVTGWGKSEDPSKLHENLPKVIKVTMQSNAQCLPRQPKFAELSSERTFCAGLTNGTGVCRGDSGGGIFVVVNGISYFKGIVSSSLLTLLSECDTTKSAIYTNLLEFKDWIRENIGEALVGSGEVLVDDGKVFCTFSRELSRSYDRFKTCKLDQAIDSENQVLESTIDATVKRILANDNKQLKFLPRQIGAKFPKLKQFDASRSGLTVVRNFYFKNMQNLKLLDLERNRIATIEKGSFDDLISVETLELSYNELETLDEKLFVTMVNLENASFGTNKLKFLSPNTFNIPGGKLDFLSLGGNICISATYAIFQDLPRDLRTQCAK